MKPTGYIVVYDDDGGLCCPMGADEACAGAVCVSKVVKIFPDRKSARKAIRISRAYAILNQEQGRPANTDFTDGIKCIKVLPCV